MFEAQYIMTKDADAGVTIYSPWFPRQGDQIRYTLDLVNADGATITVTLMHKNREDTGDGATTGSSIAATSSVGRSVVEFKTGLKEMVRYKFLVTAVIDGTVGWVAYRMLAPTWFDTVSGT